MLTSTSIGEEAVNPARMANTIILKEIEITNLGIETVKARYTEFDETIFALGRIQSIPARHSIVSSRIPGRIIEIHVFEGDTVTAGQPVVKVESRQPGNPPPSTVLRAPSGGMVMKTHSSLGEPVEPDTDILEVIDLSQVYAVARIPEDQAGLLNKGTRARITIPALPSREFQGELLRFGTTATPASGTIDAFFLLKGLDGRIRPQMRTEFSIIISSREKVMAVPKEAIQGDKVKPFVFVKDFELNNAFVKAPVRTGASNDQFVEIVSGIFPADDVVTKGAYPLSFAGTGSVSLKEALDAAHGHEHNEDGSLMSDKQKNLRGSGAVNEGNTGPLTLFLAILSTLLTILLSLSILLRRKTNPTPTSSSNA